MTISKSTNSNRLLWIQIAAWLVGLAIVVPGEVSRFAAISADNGGLAGWFLSVNPDTTAFLFLLVLAPLFWLIRLPLCSPVGWVASRWRIWFGPSTKPCDEAGGWSGWRAWALAVTVGLVSWSVSLWVASYPLQQDERATIRFGDLPPAYHDEYSYLFQARTFLLGRLSFPSHLKAPQLFDQMHVLNEGRFASRYFPAIGAWMAPFVRIGHPYWGHWLAGALTAVFIFWIGRELGGNGVGFLAGLLTGLSPGMGLFSNLLLSHHPDLLGLSLFIFSFLRMMRTGRWTYALFAGAGLSFAMLARPMTAAGIGLPFGVWLVWWVLRGCDRSTHGFGNSLRSRFRQAAVLGTPVLLGLAAMLAYNRQITGSMWVTPYQLYTDTYTPRHVFGFNNVVRGEQRLGPKVIDNYDRWAENLTPRLAMQNVRKRLIAGWQWTLGIVPLAMAGVVMLFSTTRENRRWWVIVAAILSLHAVHVPYWYAGIMHWHYVFESGPLWLLLFAGATQSLTADWDNRRRYWMPLWWSGMIVAALLSVYVFPDTPAGSRSRMGTEIEKTAFSRMKYAGFRDLVERTVGDERALILVIPDPYDRHIDYVLNEPGLNARIIYGRLSQDALSAEEIARMFPDRVCFVVNAADGGLRRIH